MVGERLDPIRAGLKHFERPRLGEGALALRYFNPNKVSGNRVADENDVASIGDGNARDPLAAVGEPFDPYLKTVAAVDPRALAFDCRLLGH